MDGDVSLSFKFCLYSSINSYCSKLIFFSSTVCGIHIKSVILYKVQTYVPNLISDWKEVNMMARNGSRGNGRKGAVKGRSQSYNPRTGLWTKSNNSTGRFMDVKTSGGSFKGVTHKHWYPLKLLFSTLHPIPKIGCFFLTKIHALPNFSLLTG